MQIRAEVFVESLTDKQTNNDENITSLAEVQRKRTKHKNRHSSEDMVLESPCSQS